MIKQKQNLKVSSALRGIMVYYSLHISEFIYNQWGSCCCSLSLVCSDWLAPMAWSDSAHSFFFFHLLFSILLEIVLFTHFCRMRHDNFYSGFKNWRFVFYYSFIRVFLLNESNKWLIERCCHVLEKADYLSLEWVLWEGMVHHVEHAGTERDW